ncbi:MAG: hypothetical protein K2Q26_11360 [Bdellovibrionales bacterium]|nr:hypothetical protein [Bdellovibrionales bacterium]
MKEQILKQINTNTEEENMAKNKKGRKSKSEHGGSDGYAMYRVVICDEANKALEDIVTKVNVGFDSGAITKSDVANFVFQNLVKHFSDADSKALRSLHFDDKKVLSTILKSEEDLPEDLKKAIRQHFGVAEKAPKKSAKPAIDLSTASSVDKSKTKDFVA